MKKSIILFLFISCVAIASAQFNSLPQNLGNVRSSDVSEQQVTQISAYMKANNFSPSQVYQLLIDRGMAPNEAALLRTRIVGVNTENPVNESRQIEERTPIRTSQVRENNIVEVSNPKKIFGLEIFSNGVLSYQPDLNIATPVNYIIGPGDQISLSIYGYQEARYNLTVSPEGDINIPLIGIVYVSGLTFEQATTKIKSKLAANGYANIRTGLTKVNITLGKIRSISVTILGEVRKPGTYTLSSLSTAFNALNLSGGPNEIGSMRLIEIIRNSKVIERLDIYDFLVQGSQSGNVRLQDQDIIRVPPYKTRVSLEGEVKRTGLFEVVQGESLEKLLDFAGGFTDSAYTASIKAYRATDTAKRIFDVSKDRFKTYMPSRAEAFVVRKLVDRITNRVVVRGAVFLPGEYELTERMTLLDLIRRASGLREDAYGERGLILRYNDDLTTELLQFSPAAVLNGTAANVSLKRGDEVTISSVFDVKEIFNVSVNGEVRRPGTFTYTPNITLKDLVLMAGGFTDAAAPQRIEISRRVRTDSFDLNDTRIAEVIEVGTGTDLTTSNADITLQPWDVVTIRRNPGYRQQVNVSVTGEVVYPGPYVIQSRTERVSDLIKRAGGLTAQASQKGVFLQRLNNSAIGRDTSLSAVKKIMRAVDDTTNAILQDITASTVKVGLSLEQILKNPRGDEDVFLQEGDVLNVTKAVLEVKINGEVMFPTQVVYKEGEDLLYYIDKAGGFTDDARKKKTYVLYSNGNASKTRRFLFIKNYPRIEPGAEVLVPKIPERKKQRLSTGEVVAITSGVASLVGVVVALLNFVK